MTAVTESSNTNAFGEVSSFDETLKAGEGTVTNSASGLKLYDTASHEMSTFEPIKPGQVGIYVCGATVQSSPHIGHIRAAVAFDIVRRWFMRLGYKVTFIRNVTDIDDKILDKARAAGQNWWERAYIYEREFTEAYNELGVLPPTYEPRATGHILDMVSLIERIIDNGHAYVIRDENGEMTGDVYFDTASWPHYGELTHQKQSAQEDEASRVADAMGPSVDATGEDKYNPVDPADLSEDKRDPRDFALWKRPKDTDPMDARWKTPFGTGRPGWHIECSAMSYRYLQDMFDIHGGGLDLRFPHHENEMAQTRAAGYRTANRWMHSAWVTAKGEKMSKSLGNGLSVPAVLAENSAWVVRYALGSVQYRSMLEWSDQTLTEAQAAFDRVSNFIERAGEVLGEQPSREEITAVTADDLPAEFVSAMNEDVNVSLALGTIFTWIRKGNSLLVEVSKIDSGKGSDSSAASSANSEGAQASANTAEAEVLPASADVSACAEDNLDPRDQLRAALVAVRAMLDTLGLDPLADPWFGAGDAKGGESAEVQALDALVQAQLAKREEARKNKDYATADQIRETLQSVGITIEDSPTGSTWSLS